MIILLLRERSCCLKKKTSSPGSSRFSQSGLRRGDFRRLRGKWAGREGRHVFPLYSHPFSFLSSPFPTENLDSQAIKYPNSPHTWSRTCHRHDSAKSGLIYFARPQSWKLREGTFVIWRGEGGGGRAGSSAGRGIKKMGSLGRVNLILKGIEGGFWQWFVQICSVTALMSLFRILKLRTSPSYWTESCKHSRILLNSSFITVHSSDSFTLSVFPFSTRSAMARNCVGRPVFSFGRTLTLIWQQYAEQGCLLYHSILSMMSTMFQSLQSFPPHWSLVLHAW